MNPSTPEQIRKCIDIAFMMSKCEKGEILYSKLKALFKKIDLEDEDMAKLLVVYYNCKEV